MLETFRLYSTLNIKNPSFSVKYFKNKKSPSAKGQRAGNVRLPLLESFRTFKGNIAIENIRLNQLVNLPV
jgi:hypothetical protein